MTHQNHNHGRKLVQVLYAEAFQRIRNKYLEVDHNIPNIRLDFLAGLSNDIFSDLLCMKSKECYFT